MDRKVRISNKIPQILLILYFTAPNEVDTDSQKWWIEERRGNLTASTRLEWRPPALAENNWYTYMH